MQRQQAVGQHAPLMTAMTDPRTAAGKVHKHLYLGMPAPSVIATETVFRELLPATGAFDRLSLARMA